MVVQLQALMLTQFPSLLVEWILRKYILLVCQEVPKNTVFRLPTLMSKELGLEGEKYPY